MPDEGSLRRSSRINLDVPGSMYVASKKKDLTMPDERSMRRSMRRCLGQRLAVSAEERALEEHNSTMSEERCLRRSPRLYSSIACEINAMQSEKRPSKKQKTSVSLVDSEILEERCVRRSSRINSAPEGTGCSARKVYAMKSAGSNEKESSKEENEVLIVDLDTSEERVSSSSARTGNSGSKVQLDNLAGSAEKQPPMKPETSVPIIDLTMLEDRWLRRSPRLSSGLLGTAYSGSKDNLKKLVALGGKRLVKKRNSSVVIIDLETMEGHCLRRSPRVLSVLAGTGNSENKDKSVQFAGLAEKQLSKKHKTSVSSICLAMSEEGFRRCSPRTSSVPSETENSAHKANSAKSAGPAKKWRSNNSKKIKGNDCFFIGEPIPFKEACKRWPWRYEGKGKGSKGQKASDDDDDEMILNVKCHYAQAEILKFVFEIGDFACVKGEEGGPNYVGKILEFFKTVDGEDYFRVQWFFRAEDTVDSKPKYIPPCDFYYDMKYSVDYSTFCTFVDGKS
ncbi:uncharacterized protein LOC122069012 isoform X2 [Macadamia integrifolia]|uniref:uncharacterized protein LOC122069012 isoform X2 n=1 Tax=Macadamia integrifolia TaxID=60698 RepID=UPI001C4FDABF|nr:uncharacterized protein LOC122069012 isoform X2 [Macadamia integrifolia]